MNLKDSYIHGGTTSSKGVVKDISLTDGSLVITYADTTSANKSISLGDYVLKSGSTMTGDLILYNGGNGTATPALVFRRGVLLGNESGTSTNYYDWRIFNSISGRLLVQVNSISADSWNTVAEFNANGLTVTGKIIKDGGTNQQVLLANGDVKSLSDFMLSNDNNITTILAQLKEEIRYYDDIYEYLNNQAIDTVVLGATNAYIDTLTVAGSTTSGNFVKSGGTNQLVLLADGTVKALSDFKIGTYVPLAGTSTSAPITGTLYSTKGIYIYPGNTTNVDIWHVDGNQTAWDNHYGFELKYLGSGSGNDNDLVLNSHNQTGTHVEVYRVHQDGQMIFGLNPKVKISGTEYEVWNKQNLTNLNQLANGPGYTTNTGTVTLVSTGVGLTGGNITTTGTIKAKLRSETALTNDSAAATETSGRVYPISVDKSGYLAVNVPWTNVNGDYVTLTGNLTISGTKTFTGYVAMGTNHYIYGANEDGGSILHFDGTRTVVGSKGASSTAATLIRSSTGHAKVGDGTNEYDVLDSNNSSVSLSGSTLTVKINNTTLSLTNTDEKVKLSVTTTADYRGIVLGYNSAANGTIDSTVTNEVYVTNNLVVRPSTGSIVSKGSGTFGGDLIFTHTGSKYITWNDGSYQQRIVITDDSTANTAVFTFLQSSDSGSTWNDLFTILDNSTAKVGTNTVLHTGDKTTTISNASTNSQIPTALAVYNAINNGFATNDALVYAGTVNGSATSPGTFFPTTALAAGSKGKVWKVAQSGYINGVAVEIGDMIICNSDSAIAVPTSSNYSTINANFDYIQTNLDPTQFVSLVGIQSISGEKTFDVLNVGNLTVTGLAQFTNTINGSINGNAATANLLLNARTLKVNLATTSAQSFNGSANAESIGVSGILPVANGGTGNSAGTIAYTKITGSSTTADMALVSTTTANTLAFKQLGSNAFDSTAYLPLTGGTLSSAGDNIFNINNSTSNATSNYIWFKVNNSNKSFVGLTGNRATLGLTGSYRIQIDSSGNFTLNSSSSDTTGSTIAHSGNSTQSAVTLSWGTNSNALKIAGTLFNVTLPSKPTYTLDDVSDGSTRKLANYLPLTGGTLSNTGNDVLTINRTTANNTSWIRFLTNSSLNGYLGISTQHELLFNNATNTYTVAHAGNSTQSDISLSWGANANKLKIAGIQFGITLPSNPNVTSHLYAGAQDGTANATSALSDPYLLLVEGSTLDSQIQVKAGTGISVSAVNGIITITNSQPDLNHNTDRYVNAATFGSITDDTGILMTLTRAGSDNNTVTARISAIASTTGRGLAPKLALSSTNTIATQSSEYVLTYKSGTETTPVWRKLPTNAFKGTASWTSNSADANYPIGFCTTASPTSGNQYDDYYNTIFTFNPSAKALKIDGCTLQYDSTNKCLKFIFTT